MNNSTEYRNAMDKICFTEAQKTSLTETLTQAPVPVKRRLPALRTALIAAMVCLVLAGSALAVTALHSAGKITPFGTGDRKEQGYHNSGYTVTYEAGRIPLSDFSDQILADTARQAASDPDGFHDVSGFDNWEAAEEYIGFNLMDNGYLTKAEKIHTSRLLKDMARSHACVSRIESDGVLTMAIADASYCIVDNGVPIRIDLHARVHTEAFPSDVDISQMDVLYPEEETDLEVFELTGSNGLTASVMADPDETYPTYYSAYFAANGVLLSVHVQYDWQNNTAPHADANAAAEAALQAVIDGFSF